MKSYLVAAIAGSMVMMVGACEGEKTAPRKQAVVDSKTGGQTTDAKAQQASGESPTTGSLCVAGGDPGQGLNLQGLSQSGLYLQTEIPGWDTIQPLLQQYCVACHGATPPVDLDTYESASANAADIWASIENDSMPIGTPIANAEHRSAIELWATNGAPEVAITQGGGAADPAAEKPAAEKPATPTVPEAAPTCVVPEMEAPTDMVQSSPIVSTNPLMRPDEAAACAAEGKIFDRRPQKGCLDIAVADFSCSWQGVAWEFHQKGVADVGQLINQYAADGWLLDQCGTGPVVYLVKENTDKTIQVRVLKLK